jgi:hypothetical protein
MWIALSDNITTHHINMSLLKQGRALITAIILISKRHRNVSPLITHLTRTPQRIRIAVARETAVLSFSIDDYNRAEPSS